MSIFSNQFIDIIDWTQSDRDTMVYRFPRYKNEIKYGAKLTVREGQVAAFVNEGKLADIFPPGIYQLETANLPILSTLQNWHHGFESPFKAEVYFFNTTDFLNLKWGTKQAITLNDSQFGLVRLRAFGSFTTRIDNAEIFLKKLVGTDGQFEIDEVSEQLSNYIVAALPSVLSSANISVAELSLNYNNLATATKGLVDSDFNQYGLILNKIYIENISLPNEVQKVLDEKTGMNIIGKDIASYTQYKAAQSLDNSNTTGAMASAGIGMAVGANMANQMLNNINNANNTKPTQLTPPEISLPKIYYLMILGERKGPMNINQIYQLFDTGEIDISTLIWHKGMNEWQTIKLLNEFDISAYMPPDLPK